MIGCIRDKTEDDSYIQKNTCDALTRLISGTIVERVQLQLPTIRPSSQTASLSVLASGGTGGSGAVTGGTGHPCACRHAVIVASELNKKMNPGSLVSSCARKSEQAHVQTHSQTQVPSLYFTHSFSFCTHGSGVCMWRLLFKGALSPAPVSRLSSYGLSVAVK